MEEVLVQRTELDDYLLMDAERPAFMTEQQGGERGTGVLLELLQEVLCRKQEVDEVAQAVPSVAAVHHAEDLTEDGGGRGLEGREEGR